MNLETGAASRTERYMEALLSRHLKDLKFSEVTQGLRALSNGYVEKREAGGLARALQGRGKRAAFGLYYGATHFLTTSTLVRNLGFGFPAPLEVSGKPKKPAEGRSTILDLGCGTGVCGAAWALGSASSPLVIGVDRSSFALHEARWTFQTLGLRAETSRSITEALETARRPSGIVIGWTLNELDDLKRAFIAERILPWVRAGTRLIVIEPVSKRVAPWWDPWTAPFLATGGVVSEQRLRLDLPSKIALLGRSAGLTAESAVVRVLTTPAGAPFQETA